MGEKSTTSRFKRVPAAQRKIGYRLVYLRRCNEIPQSGLAANAGLTTAQLANIESGRVPLRLYQAWKLCESLDIHPGWLCTGRRERPFLRFNPETMAWLQKVVTMNKDALFYDVWVSISWLTEETDEMEAYRAKLVKSGHVPAFPSVPRKNSTLPYGKHGDITLGVKAQLPDLLARLKLATRERGSKALLAKRVLKVPAAMLSQWLSGKKEPGGEYALKLLRWVEQQEQQ